MKAVLVIVRTEPGKPARFVRAPGSEVVGPPNFRIEYLGACREVEWQGVPLAERFPNRICTTKGIQK